MGTNTHFAKITSLTTIAESEAEPAPARIAVAIPCYNEAAAIATVTRQFRAALPEAAIVVYDNNSTDGTDEIARGLGVRVVPVFPPREGARGASGVRGSE